MPVVFMDFDDTLSEQIPFNLQYVRGLGNALAPIYGGEVEEWAKYAVDMMVAMETDYQARFRNDPLSGYCEWLPEMLAQAVKTLFMGRQLPTPANPEVLARQMRREALLRCNALFPGTLEAMQELHRRGVKLHMASGNDSDHLRAALAGSGLDAYFDRLYGPDLVDCAKEGPEFYVRILADMNLPARDALFIDNDPAAIDWAHAAGAQAIQVKLLTNHVVATATDVIAVITELSQLPGLIASW